jgi:hypothetical protein
MEGYPSLTSTATPPASARLAAWVVSTAERARLARRRFYQSCWTAVGPTPPCWIDRWPVRAATAHVLDLAERAGDAGHPCGSQVDRVAALLLFALGEVELHERGGQWFAVPIGGGR